MFKLIFLKYFNAFKWIAKIAQGNEFIWVAFTMKNLNNWEGRLKHWKDTFKA